MSRDELIQTIIDVDAEISEIGTKFLGINSILHQYHIDMDGRHFEISNLEIVSYTYFCYNFLIKHFKLLNF